MPLDSTPIANNKWKLYVFFPITLYMIAGTAVLYSIYRIDSLAFFIGKYSRNRYFLQDFAHPWHKESPWFTAFFPLLAILLTAISLTRLLYSIVCATIRFAHDLVVYIWKKSIQILMEVLEMIRNALKHLSDTFRAIWGQISRMFD